MNTVFYILITALVIGFLTFIHEFGHFFFARLFKFKKAELFEIEEIQRENIKIEF